METEHKDIFAKCQSFDEAERVRAMGIYPYFRAIEAMSGNQVIVNGRRRIMVGSNNYLGLAQDERVIEAVGDAARKYGSGCTGSRFLSGTIKLHEDLEGELAEFLQRESVLLFSTGFLANIGPLQTLLEDGDFILCDRENHASIVDGCRMSRAKTVPYSHNSSDALRRRFRRMPADGGKMVIVDGIFSMSGDLVNLPEVVAAAKEYGARVYVDEAHALGVVGPKGEGAAHHFGLNKEVDLVMGTFSKSLGGMGGFVAGPKYVIEYLKHKARCFIFTASLSPSVAGGVLKALQIMRAEPERKDMLWKNTRKMHEGFKSMGFKIGTTQSPIVPLMIGSETKALIFSQKLFEAGIFTTPAVYPAVRYGEAIVRTSYMATHSDEELDYVLETCQKLFQELRIFEESVYTGENKRRLNGGYDLFLPGQEAAQTFEKVPELILKNDPNFVPPFPGSVAKIFSPKSSFANHGELIPIIAERDGKTVGRIAAIVNRSHNAYYKDRTGFFGFFDCINDPEVAKVLFETAKGELRKRGLETLRGPYSPTINDECGLLTEGFDSPPFVMMPYNPQYYLGLYDQLGLESVRDLAAFYIDSKVTAPERIRKIVERVKRSTGIKVRNVDMKNLNSELKIIQELYNVTLDRNWGFVPVTYEDLVSTADDLKAIADPNMVLIAEKEGKPVGFSLTLPNINEIMFRTKKNGVLMRVLKFLWYLKTSHPTQARLIVLGVAPEFRNKGMGALFYYETLMRGKKNYIGGEMSWVDADNEEIVHGITVMGGRQYKNYRIFETGLAN